MAKFFTANSIIKVKAGLACEIIPPEFFTVGCAHCKSRLPFMMTDKRDAINVLNTMMEAPPDVTDETKDCALTIMYIAKYDDDLFMYQADDYIILTPQVTGGERASIVPFQTFEFCFQKVEGS